MTDLTEPLMLCIVCRTKVLFQLIQQLGMAHSGSGKKAFAIHVGKGDGATRRHCDDQINNLAKSKIS